jgi:peptide/nickel transport system substrate-binding protein
VKNETTGIFEKKKGTGVEKLSFTLATANVPDLIAAANILKESWKKVGIAVDLKLFESGDLTENVIRTREYDAVLFGLRNGRDPDPYPFWHSSQRLDPGLNISLYANKEADVLLEEARTTTDTGERIKLYQRFSQLIEKDVPAIFLYAPTYRYYAPHVSGLNVSAATTPSDRFNHVYNWYRYTERVWNIFLGTTNQS